MEKLTTSSCRYSLLASALQHDIKEGKYAVGKALPTEMELCDLYNVSRCTVREALRQLRQRGLVTSRQGSGTIVAATVPVSRYVQSMESHEEFLEFLKQARAKILKCDTTVLPKEMIHLYGLPNPQQLWLHIKMLRFWGKPKLPTLLTDAYIDAKYSGIKENYDGSKTLNEVLEKKYGVHIETFLQDIQAIQLDKQQSQILKADLHAPALQTMRRCYTASNELLIISCNVSPADRYTYSTKMRISSGVNR